MTPHEFADEMRALYPARGYDEELAHRQADTLMCETLCALEFTEGVAVFLAADKWYA